MDRNKLKTYAPQARKEFIQAMTDRAAFYGLTPTKTEPVSVRGDVAVIGGREHPRAIAEKRRKLEARVKRDGFEQTMEAMAYTWFNRFAAIRFMELHEYLDHGLRVLSHPEGKAVPEILEKAEIVDLPGLNKAKVIDLKMDGGKDRELYRMLLVAQCNALNAAMPFLFERIDDETELLLPDNLLASDSLIRKLVAAIDENDWNEIEIIGWLYQFYISEKKDQVIGKVVKSEDIPAATQLFTPNWIVKYMVQNSLGAMWLATYPNSSVRAGMAYFVPPADQTPEVAAQIAAVTPKEIDPEKITFLDPAVGSGHIVVEAYDLLLAIYMDRGYPKREAVRSILTKNLFGLDIDNRAAQLAGFALLMKARADDRTILKNPPKLNILALQDSAGINADAVADALLAEEAKFELVPPSDLMPETLPQPTLALRRDDTRIRNAIKSIVAIFGSAKTFGSLLTVPDGITACLSSLDTLISRPIAGDLFAQQAQTDARDQLAPLIEQARILGGRYDCVVANPPYMGTKGMNLNLKEFAQTNFSDSKLDLFSMFIERSFALAADNGLIAMITMQSWMFLSSFERLRRNLLDTRTILNMAHLGPRAFDSINGDVVQTSTFILRNRNMPFFNGYYFRLVAAQSETEKRSTFCEAIHGHNGAVMFKASADDFMKLPNMPLAYWISGDLRDCFLLKKIASLTYGEGKNVTSNNSEFVRYWWEVARTDIGRDQKWLPYAKGGAYRKWAGNIEHVVDWSPHTRQFYRSNSVARIIPENLWYKKGITWTDVSGGQTGFRYLPPDTTFDATGLTIFLKEDRDIEPIMGLLNSNFVKSILPILNPTMHVQLIDVKAIPVPSDIYMISEDVSKCIEIASNDWDSFENSLSFERIPVMTHDGNTIEISQQCSDDNIRIMRDKIRLNENNINEKIISVLRMGAEISNNVSDKEITIHCPDAELDAKRLLSYAIGCMMGRYSLDEPGLSYAQSGNKDFDASRYMQFAANDDGIVPLLNRDWGMQNDATSLFEKFIKTAWPKENLEANLKFVADSLGPNNGEAARDTIRRYLSAGFYKHHLTTYKKRPIYWLFSSGKERAFQCLVYLHRYNEGTLARMRTEYVIPHQGRISTRIEQLEEDKATGGATSRVRALQKEQDDLKKQYAELAVFEEKLNHYASQMISLDLDDGVKVNYGKFGDLLADVKAITGGKDDE